MISKNIVFAGVAVLASASAFAELMDRTGGIRVGQRMTIHPSVSLSYIYDSNRDCLKHHESSSAIRTKPAVSAEYRADNWTLFADTFYMYDAYVSGYSKRLNNSKYGESLRFAWEDGFTAGKGWALSLSESYRYSDEDDDMQKERGRGTWRDHQEFNANGSLQRRINENWHAGILGGYYWLDYDNDEKRYATMYGWQRWQGAGEIGFIASKWTDFFIQAGYQGYEQDNDRTPINTNYRHIDNTSDGYTVSLGVGSFLTERITYRFSGGWSRFEYGDASDVDGFTYQASFDWQFARTWRTKLLAASYYQPSEQYYGTASRIDYVTWGISKSLVRNRLQSKFDVTYRREGREYSASNAGDYSYDLMICRLGFDYRINRFFALFLDYELQEEFNESGNYKDYDYDRHRLSVGFRLTY